MPRKVQECSKETQIWKPEEEELVVCAPFTNRTVVAGGFPIQLVLRKIFA